MPDHDKSQAAQGWILVALLAAATPAAAGSFSVAPIRVEMGQGHSRGVLTLHNDSDAPVTVQINTVDWSQPGGEDRYAATHDLLTTPPVFVVAANAEQVVRVALRRGADATRELAYRLFFEEVPPPATDGFTGLRVALRIGIPVFVAPTSGTTAPDVAWRARANTPGVLEIEASNHGTAHLQITDFEVQIGSAAQSIRVGGSRYVLPDSTAGWKLTPPAGADLTRPLRIHAFTDHGEIFADVARAAP